MQIVDLMATANGTERGTAEARAYCGAQNTENPRKAALGILFE